MVHSATDICVITMGAVVLLSINRDILSCYQQFVNLIENTKMKIKWLLGMSNKAINFILFTWLFGTNSLIMTPNKLNLLLTLASSKRNACF